MHDYCCQFWVNKDMHTNTYFADVASSDLALTSNSSDWAFSSSENIQKNFFLSIQQSDLGPYCLPYRLPKFVLSKYISR